MKVVAAPFAMALLLSLVRVGGVERDGLMRSNVENLSLDDTPEGFEDQGPPKNVLRNFFCQSCHDVIGEKILSDTSFNEEASTLSPEVCQMIMNSGSQIKCRELVELYYLREGILFLQVIFLGNINPCNNPEFCPFNDSTISMSTSHGNRFLSSMEPKIVSLREMGIESLMQLESKVLSVMEKSSSKMRVGNGCDVCHATRDQICKDLLDHDQQVEIMRWAFDACEVFQNHVNQCKRFIFEYGPLFLANLHKFLESEDVCQLIRMCAEP